MCFPKLLVAALFSLAATTTWAQQRPAATKPAPPKTAQSASLDKAALEQYVRHLFVWGPQIDVKIADPKPSTELPGFNEVIVSARAGQASQEDTFYVSNDGRRIF